MFTKHKYGGLRIASGSWDYFFHSIGPRNHTQDLRVGVRCLYLLSHLPGPDFMSSLNSNPLFIKTFRWSYVVFLFLLLSGSVDEKNVHGVCFGEGHGGGGKSPMASWTLGGGSEPQSKHYLSSSAFGGRAFLLQKQDTALNPRPFRCVARLLVAWVGSFVFRQTRLRVRPSRVTPLYSDLKSILKRAFVFKHKQWFFFLNTGHIKFWPQGGFISPFSKFL